MQRPTFRSLLSATALAVFSLAGATSQAASFSKLVIFGDSLSDSGNNYLGIVGVGGTVPDQTISGNTYIPFPPYLPFGTYSNGPVWAS